MTVNSEHHPNGRGIIRRLVSRVRSGSDGYKHHPTDDINFHDVDQLPSSFNGEPQQGRKSSSSSIHSTSAPSGHGFFRPPTFRSTHSTTSNAADGGEKRGLAYRYRRAARSRSRSTTPTRRGNKGRDAELKLSRDLWDDAYDSLRLDPSTCSLVTTYEAIIAQELPDEHKLAAHGALTNAEGDADRRADLMAEIVRAGLLKRRGSKTSQVQDAARLVLQHSKQAVQDAWELNPAAAVAWAGLCTLTPLLIDPILGKEEFRNGMVHLVGRISWYMNLTQLILSPSWHDADDFAARREDFARHGAENRDAISRLYRRVLEFEMNCVCAAASAWNNRAKQVVCWKRVGRLVEDLRAADEKVHALVQANIKEARLRDDLLACDADLDLDEIERLDRETGDRWDDVNEDKASANQEPPDWNYKPVTIMA